MDETLRHLIDLAKRHYDRADYAQARTLLEQITAKHQGYADIYNMLAVVYHDAGLFSKAQAALEQALSINPRYTEAALNLAVLYNDMGRYDDARAVYSTALAQCGQARDGLDPFVAGKIANMHADVAEAYRNAGQPDRAVEEYRKALQLRPTFADIRTLLAVTLMQERHLSAALSELQQALLDRPNYQHARIQWGVCSYAMGKREDAIGAWTQVLQEDPQNASAAMYLRMVRADANVVLPPIDHA